MENLEEYPRGRPVDISGRYGFCSIQQILWWVGTSVHLTFEKLNANSLTEGSGIVL